MKKLLLFLCLLAQTGFAQIPRLDSLKQVLTRLQKLPEDYTNDTITYNTLKAIMTGYVDVDIDSSFQYNTRMIRLCQKANLHKELIYAYQYAGYIYQLRGDYDQTIRFHYKALPLAEKLKQYTRMAKSLGALAHAYMSLEQYEKAIKLCRQGLNVLRQHPDTTIQLSILNTFGAIYRGQGKFAEALQANQIMYELAHKKHIRWFEAQGLHTIGWDYMELGDTIKPLDYFTKALVLAREVGSADLEKSILIHIGDVFASQKKWSQALAYYNMVKQTAIRLKNSSIVAEANEKLYSTFKQMGEPAKALNAYEEFVFLKDSLATETNEQQIETLQALYENEQKKNLLQKQAAQQKLQKLQMDQYAQIQNGLFLGIVAILLGAMLLFRNNRQLQAKNQKIDQQRTLLETAREQLADINKTLEIRVAERTEELLSANRELVRKNEEIKSALFKGQTIERKRVALELHDNLSSLLSAVNMSIQAINPQNLSNAEQSVYRNVKQLIQNAYSEVRNISHNILPAGLEQEGLVATLTTLVGQLNQNSPLQFSLLINGLTARLPVEIEFNVYSIVFELINNAIRHANATQVIISLVRTDQGIDISVADDGIGMGQFSTKRGVGLQNIQTRLDSLGGTFDTNLPVEKGTCICIKIPIEMVSFNGNAALG
ncbi:tetratricopeptide repeat-containing sensor histidine kinase [Spirosoma linguale]|uniref:histidine kinase n=1 Tax=Spirosoma linguale (strain ATCC 33905 / DSM 74 / LMG 10896 / Claus 1) TaxID=504472 RepID=D2QUB4_SPILD|nr:histidine kinase [Spirosoma linguale DSM 74]